MTERERLIQSVKQSLHRHIGKSCKLAENITDDLIADGVIVAPVKMGQKFYHIEEYKHSLIPECYPTAKVVCESTVDYVKKDIYSGKFGDSRKTFFWGDVGKTVFLSREEAEKALEGGGGE